MAVSIPTVVFITGIGRGIGKALAEAYLCRPNHTVIGSVRDKSAPSALELKKLPTSAGSRLLLVSIESTSPTDPSQAVKHIEAAGINHLDLVIANAGICPAPMPLTTVDPRDVSAAFNINAVGPLMLFQAVRPLLEKSRSPKWMTVSTGASSITCLEVHGAHGVPGYAIGKTGANWFTVAVHSSEKWLTAFAIHPGLVQTDMGNMGAQMMGMDLAPNTLKESTTKTMALIDNATRDKTSGRFFDVINNTELPW